MSIAPLISMTVYAKRADSSRAPTTHIVSSLVGTVEGPSGVCFLTSRSTFALPLACEEGFSKHGVYCFKLIHRPESFHNAVKRCRDDYGAKLVMPVTSNERAFLAPLCNQPLCWIGAHYQTSVNAWEYLDGTPLKASTGLHPYSPPTSRKPDQSCGALSPGHLTLDVPKVVAQHCNTSLPYICRKPRRHMEGMPHPKLRDELARGDMKQAGFLEEVKELGVRLGIGGTMERVKRSQGFWGMSKGGMGMNLDLSLLQVRETWVTRHLKLPVEYDVRKHYPFCFPPDHSEVQSQGYCGACWAFALLGALSDRACIANPDRMISNEMRRHLSVQQVLSCAGWPRMNESEVEFEAKESLRPGCEGGWASIALEYIRNKGVGFAEDYPYEMYCWHREASPQTVEPGPNGEHGNGRPHVARWPTDIDVDGSPITVAPPPDNYAAMLETHSASKASRRQSSKGQESFLQMDSGEEAITTQEGCRPDCPQCISQMPFCAEDLLLKDPATPSSRVFINEYYRLSRPGEQRATGGRACVGQVMRQMQMELISRGPFFVAFEVYPDFFEYFTEVPDGVYSRDDVSGDSPVGSQSAVLVGWDEEDGTLYWLLRNSWGTSFAANGYFKMERGRNVCRVEEWGIYAAVVVPAAKKMTHIFSTANGGLSPYTATAYKGLRCTEEFCMKMRFDIKSDVKLSEGEWLQPHQQTICPPGQATSRLQLLPADCPAPLQSTSEFRHPGKCRSIRIQCGRPLGRSRIDRGAWTTLWSTTGATDHLSCGAEGVIVGVECKEDCAFFRLTCRHLSNPPQQEKGACFGKPFVEVLGMPNALGKTLSGTYEETNASHPLNGKPHWQKGGVHLYWIPPANHSFVLERLQRGWPLPTATANGWWVFDTDLDTREVLAYAPSRYDFPPSGKWRVRQDAAMVKWAAADGVTVQCPVSGGCDADSNYGVSLCSDRGGGCVDEPGSFRCECERGFRMQNDGFRCEKGASEDPCAMDNGNCDQYCDNRRDGAHCSCRVGYERVDTACKEIDECSIETSPCPRHADCINTPGGFYCQCRAGWLPADDWNTTCIDEDECLKNPCQDQCFDYAGGHTCGCPLHMQKDLAGDCQPIMCRDMEAPCGEDGKSNCRDTPKGYECVCKDGFHMDPHADQFHPLCVDIDECVDGIDAKGTPACRDPKRKCVNNEGGFECRCREGYKEAPDPHGTGEGQTICQDINECEAAPDVCGDSTTTACVNTEGGFECQCLTGFVPSLDHTKCEDLNECALTAGGATPLRSDITTRHVNRGKYTTVNPDFILPQAPLCGDDATCANTVGEYSCVCGRKGFRHNELTMKCEDVDECAEKKDVCSGGICTNTEGGYQCLCDTGYRPSTDGTQCIDINECNETLAEGQQQRPGSVCPPPLLGCRNLPGRYTCECPPGFAYSFEDRTCEDIDECSHANGGCNGACINTNGSFS
ncbi:unnamed protein product [Vitrella brassicaformis CCMP3155]|uniref:Uncharacterized protein n=1 Tax=Vitrella brassicaformis (strain CCMP3155) TaxID=1169540 RepID=A0A0G4EUE0_VITBC|nr:unnamed protein product [Vitrella brassicaformis CCMP3155]|eukprot:CEM01908.1 unnamed protein product [Vitrella brassicaformis CCMP3155]